jgi:hypothetical protein
MDIGIAIRLTETFKIMNSSTRQRTRTYSTAIVGMGSDTAAKKWVVPSMWIIDNPNALPTSVRIQPRTHHDGNIHLPCDDSGTSSRQDLVRNNADFDNAIPQTWLWLSAIPNHYYS